MEYPQIVSTDVNGCLCKMNLAVRAPNVHKERISVTMDWLIAEASRQLEGGEPAVHGGASDEMVLKETADVGHLCQKIVERYVRP